MGAAVQGDAGFRETCACRTPLQTHIPPLLMIYCSEPSPLCYAASWQDSRSYPQDFCGSQVLPPHLYICIVLSHTLQRFRHRRRFHRREQLRLVQCSCLWYLNPATSKCAMSFFIYIVFAGKVSVGSNSNILESSLVTASEASAVSIGSNVVIEQVACFAHLLP